MRYMKFVYFHVFTFLKKKNRISRNLLCHHGQTPDTKITKTCSSEKFFQRRSFFLINVMALEQASIRLDSSLHAFKAARSAPLSIMIPKSLPGARQRHLTRRIPTNTQ